MELVTLAAAIDLTIAMGYLTFAFVVITVLGYRLYKWSEVTDLSKTVKIMIVGSLAASFMFFVGCAGTHFEMVAHYSAYPSYAEEVAPHMIAVGIPQAIGVWGPVLLAGILNREFARAVRIKEKLDEHVHEE